MASRRRDLGRPLLVALCVVALFAVGSESHGLEDFREGNTEATPAMASFFGSKPEAAELPEALDASNAAAATAKPEAACKQAGIIKQWLLVSAVISVITQQLVAVVTVIPQKKNWIRATLSRIGEVKRVTKETNVHVKINLDGTGVADCSTGIPFLDHMLDVPVFTHAA
ncbi:hypothetical protein OsI_17415 [Oryza sativa Indica Group]|uniref:Uncharacterized protein n=1 Tax=Oryza sativa subsp. indica TaxID=39946 RepID=A2XXK8_ORYSI|nr:hypothetical protein OsI_17415 [Oryza sativa Indica Group]